MSPESLLLLVVIAVAVVLFSFEWLPADVVALGVLVSLILLRIVPAEEAFLGFGNEAVLMILGLLVMTAALAKTGVVALVGAWVIRRIGTRPNRVLPVIMGSSAGLSAFMSNTGATAFFLPIVLSLARQLRVSANRLLMPLAFSAVLASSVTLIGTSTNIVISGMMTTYGLQPLGMFELTVVGLPILLLGLGYMLTIGHRLIPDRGELQGAMGGSGLRPYLFEMLVPERSEFVGRTLAQSRLGEQFDLSVLRIVRRGENIVMPAPDLVLRAGDRLLVEAERDQALQATALAGLELVLGVEPGDVGLESAEVGLYEVVLLPGSPILKRSAAELSLRQRYGLQILAINHHGRVRYDQLSRINLQAGDQLLVRAHHSNVRALEEDDLFRVVSLVPWSPPNTRRAALAGAIFVAVLAAASLNLMALPVAVILGTFLMFVSGCITPEEAYRELQWKSLILVGSMLSLGIAIERTGTAAYFANWIADATQELHPSFLLAGFFGLTMLLTQPMSNQAAAIVVVPIAIQTALGLDLNPRAFAVMIALGASCSFLTPLEPACLLVFGAGNYRFMDFFKVGLLLTVLILALSMALVPMVWPL